MRGPKPPPIVLTPTQRVVLRRLARRQSGAQRLVRRARIILEAASGANNDQIATLLGIDRGTVRTWRMRWLEALPRLKAAEKRAGGSGGGGDDDDDDERVVLAGLVEEVLVDEPRSGKPATFTPEQICQIVALACEEPREESGRPISHWSTTELAYPRPSNGASWRASRHAVWAVFWGEADLKPHLVRPWKHNERAAEPEIFDAQVRGVCECYAEALHLYEEGVHLMSTDEKSGIQALERVHPKLPMRPGLIERHEHEYERHGTRCLFANLEVATGRVIAPSIGPSRTNEDFASHVAQTIATDPDAGWIFVVDQLNIHQSEALVKLVAKELGIELELDRKGYLKNIKAMASRRTFLSDRTHRIRFVYTPKHTSWLNQIELWFSILVRKLLKRGSFTSVEDLRQRILAFIEYFNRALAKPFKWTYKGRPLKV